MKKFLFLCFSVLFTNFLLAQVTVNAPGSVEVGINNNFGFTFLPSNDVPSNSSTYKLTSWFINCGSSNMNNSGYGYYNDNSQSLNIYGIGQSQSLNFPIKWEDNSSVLTADISIITNVVYYGIDANGNTYQTGSRIHPNTYTVNINRIFTPTISSQPILSCCSSPVTFSASNFGTANVFNWTISGGTYTGSGSSITVTPSAGSGAVYASCIVSRSSGLSSYTRSNSATVSRTARTASFIALYPEYANNTPPIFYMCKGSAGRQMSMPTQCGFSSVNWVAPNCTIVGQGTLTPTITPLSTVATGTTINVSATVTFTGGCTAPTQTTSFTILDSTVAPTPVGYFTATPSNGNICTTPIFDIEFVSTNGFNNGIVTTSKSFIWGPGDTAHYRKNVATAVTVCNKNLCTGLTTCKVFNVFPPAPCAGARMANSSTNEKLIIAPNPSNGNVKVTLPDAISGTYQIYDQANSTLVQESKFDNQSELQIDLSQKLRNGIYVLKVITENNTFTEKIILNK